MIARVVPAKRQARPQGIKAINAFLVQTIARLKAEAETEMTAREERLIAQRQDQ